jgi:streptogramin lyase
MKRACVASGMGPAWIAIAASEDSVWALTDARGTLSRIDPVQNEVVAEFRVFADCRSLTFGETALWLACPAENKVLRIDPKTNKITKTIETGAPAAGGTISFGEGSVWVSTAAFPLTRIDPTTEKVAQQFWGTGGGVVQAGAGSVWLAGKDTGKLLRFDPRRIAATLAE